MELQQRVTHCLSYLYTPFSFSEPMRVVCEYAHIYVCMCVCMDVSHILSHGHRGQKRASDPLAMGLALKEVVAAQCCCWELSVGPL